MDHTLDYQKKERLSNETFLVQNLKGCLRKLSQILKSTIFHVCYISSLPSENFFSFAPSWNFSFLFSDAIQFYSQYLTKNQITQNPNLSPIHLNWYHVSSLWFNSLTEIWLRKADLVDFIIYNLGSFPKSSCLFSRYLGFFVCLKP